MPLARINRRILLIAAAATTAWPLRVVGQAKLLRLGYVGLQPRNSPRYNIFLKRMAELGYQEGQNLAFEYLQTPSVEGYLAAYRELAERKVDVFLAAGNESALLAARSAPVPVHCVDSRQVGIGTGFSVMSAAVARDAGLGALDVVSVAQQRAEATSSFFYVDTLEYLRRGGRVGAAAALVGGALAVKPLMGIVDGSVTPLEKVRTAARALSRLADLTVAAAGEGETPLDIGVAHLANPTAAAELAERLAARLGDRLQGREVFCGEVGAVLGAHVGPGMVAACVAPVPE